MTDDELRALAERLEKGANNYIPLEVVDVVDASAAILGLMEERKKTLDDEARLRALADFVRKLTNEKEAAESRLSKAVEALRHYRCDCDGTCEAGHKDSMACGERARSVLAEIGGLE